MCRNQKISAGTRDEIAYKRGLEVYRFHSRTISCIAISKVTGINQANRDRGRSHDPSPTTRVSSQYRNGSRYSPDALPQSLNGQPLLSFNPLSGGTVQAFILPKTGLICPLLTSPMRSGLIAQPSEKKIGTAPIFSCFMV